MNQRGFTTLLFCLGLLFGGAQTSLAQVALPASTSELKKLDFLLGEWQGTGWIEFGPKQRHTFRQSEKITHKAGGSIVVIEGLGLAQVDGREVPVHQAYAILNYDKHAKQFRMRAWRADGEEVQADPKIGAQNLQWGFTDARSQMHIRFTIRLNEAGQWSELGESSRDGQTWHQFFEMTLSKTPKS